MIKKITDLKEMGYSIKEIDPSYVWRIYNKTGIHIASCFVHTLRCIIMEDQEFIHLDQVSKGLSLYRKEFFK